MARQLDYHILYADFMRRQTNKQGKIMSVSAFDRVIDQKYAEYVVKLRREKPNAPWEQIKAEAKGMISASFFGF